MRPSPAPSARCGAQVALLWFVLAAIAPAAAPNDPTVDAVTSPTNAATVVITGSRAATGAPADRIDLYVDTGTLGVLDGEASSANTTAFAGDAFSLPAQALTANATNRFLVVASNAGDQSNVIAVTIVQDGVAPAAPTVASPTARTGVATTPFTVAGTAEADALVRIRRGGTVIATQQLTLGATAFSIAAPLLVNQPNDLTVTATDAAGNESAQTTVPTIVHDNVAPTAAFAVVAPDPRSTAVTSLALTFSEGVSGVDPGDLALTRGGTPVSLAGATVTAVSPTAWTVNLPAAATSPAGSYVLTLTAAGSGIADLVAGNALTVNASEAWVCDTTAPTQPTIAIASPTSDPTPTATITLGEAGLTVTVTIDGVAVATQTVAGTSLAYAPALALADGSHTIAAVATDAAGNASTAGSAVVVVDTQAPPAPVIATPASGARTNDTTPTFTGSAEVGAAVRLSDGTTTWGPVTATGGAWSITTGVLAPGTRSFTATATDAAGNPGAASAAVTLTVDTTAPTLAITPNGTTTADAPIEFRLTFSEAATIVDPTGITVTNGTKGTLAAIDATTFAQLVAPTTAGAVTLTVAASAARDLAGNAPAGPGSATVTYDASLVSLTITPNPAATVTKASPIVFRCTFGQSVTGFAAGDITATNGTVAGVTSISGSVYDVSVTPSAQGLVQIMVPNGAATGTAPANPSAAASGSVTWDSVRPTPVVSHATGFSNAASIVFDVVFDEPVVGLAAGDFTVANGAAALLTGSGSVYALSVTAAAPGTVTVALPAARCTDFAGGNDNQATASAAGCIYDTTPPTVSAVTPSGGSVNGNPIEFAITFSEPVAGFDAGDVVVANGTAGTFTGSGTAYSLFVAPVGTAPVAVGITIGAGSFTDRAGNAFIGPYAGGTTYDNRPVAVTVTTAAAITRVNPVFRFTFAQNVTGFASGDITVSNGSVTAFSGSGAVYDATVAPSGQGTVAVSIAAGAATGVAPANPTAAASGSIVYDTSAPTRSLLSPADDSLAVPAGSDLTVTFNEPVLLASGNVSLRYDGAVRLVIPVDNSNPAAGTVTVSGAQVTIDPAAPLVAGKGYNVLIANGAITDLAGNAYNGISNNATWNFQVQPLSSPVEAVNAGITVPVGGQLGITAAQLLFTDADSVAADLTYTVVTPPAKGDLLRIAGSTSVIGVAGTFTQAHIDAGQIFYRNTDFTAASDSFVFRVEDETAPAETGLSLFAITITGANADPFVFLTPNTSVLYVENAPAQPVAATATVVDDNTSFPGGVLTIGFDDPPGSSTADEFDGGIPGDRLVVAAGSGITLAGSAISSGGTVMGTIDPVHDGLEGRRLVISLSAVAGVGATPASVQQLLRNLTYANVREDVPDATRTLRVRLEDGNVGSGEDGKQVTTQTVEDVPAISAVEDVVTLEGVAFTGEVSAADLDDATLWYEVDPAAAPGFGSVVFPDPNDGAFIYTPGPGLFGTESFGVRVRDAAGGGTVSPTATIAVAITRLSDPHPLVLGDPPLMVDEGGALVHTVAVDPATIVGPMRYKLVGDVPPGAIVNPSGVTASTSVLLFWPAAALPAGGSYHDFGLLAIDTGTATPSAGYLPILLKVASLPTGGN